MDLVPEAMEVSARYQVSRWRSHGDFAMRDLADGKLR